jgi:hypothetical protein
MVFFNMIPSLVPPEKPKPSRHAKTLKNRLETNTKKTSKQRRGRKIKLAPKKMSGGQGDCDTTGLLITEPGLNVPSMLKGTESGLNINKTVARIERSNSKK